MTDIHNNNTTPPAWRGLITALVFALLGIALAGAADAADTNSSGGALRARHGVLQDRLNHNQFQRPLALDSSETTDGVAGSIHARVNHPFATVAAALKNPGQWCDILSLHLNTKYCRAVTNDVLNVTIGKKFDQPLDEAYPITFAWRVTAQTTDYLQVRLNAGEGPLNTSDYRIVLEAIPLGRGQTFIHLSYSYSYGLVGRLAMQAYLGTAGRDKVGFSVSGTGADGQPRHVGGMRGVVERNTMRYYLAIEAYLGALSQPLQARFEKRLHDWFAATEHYPRQLHEMERGEYLDMKRREHRRQQVGLSAAGAG
jgi:hypothetical protein